MATTTSMNKAEILDSIRRVAAANKGKAPGAQRLATEIGLRKADWYPKLWVRWGDAVREAGLEPNSFHVALPDEVLIAKLLTLIRQLGRFPIESDLILNRGNDDFPDRNAFLRLGNKRQRVARVLAFCREKGGFEDVIPLCEAVAVATQSPRERLADPSVRGVGYVYLIKHSNRAEYKIGRTLNPIRREGEIRLELPEKLRPVHYIKTDDPPGVEKYWHDRFAKQAKEGEWFALTSADVQAFKRWKRIF
jgi:hypothetical protein